MKRQPFALLLAVLACIVPGEVRPQQKSVSQSAADQHYDSGELQHSDIVVKGLPPIVGKPPVKIGQPGGRALATRMLAENSAQFMRCAKELNVKLLRAVIDGKPSTSSHALALDQLLHSKAGCVHSLPIGMVNLGGCNPKITTAKVYNCQSFYDRGVILDAAIRRFVPDLELTTGETSDPAVQERFNRREVPRNRFRQDSDKLYFEVAVCMVRQQPKLAVALVQSPFGGKDQQEYEDAMIYRTRSCYGYANKLEFDPTQFRIYITDAVYRWEVAARNVDTLLRVQPGAGS